MPNIKCTLTVEFANSEQSVEEQIYLTDKHLTHSDYGGSVSAYVERNLNPAPLLQTDLESTRMMQTAAATHCWALRMPRWLLFLRHRSYRIER